MTRFGLINHVKINNNCALIIILCYIVSRNFITFINKLIAGLHSYMKFNYYYLLYNFEVNIYYNEL